MEYELLSSDSARSFSSYSRSFTRKFALLLSFTRREPIAQYRFTTFVLFYQKCVYSMYSVYSIPVIDRWQYTQISHLCFHLHLENSNVVKCEMPDGR